MSRRRLRSQNHLESLSTNLESVVPALAERFACPICLKVFDRSEWKRGAVNKAHIIPKALGYGMYTLACSECNSRAAKLHDTDLTQYAKLIWGIPSGVGARVQVKLNRGELVQATVTRRGKRIENLVIHIPDSSSRRALGEIDSLLATRPPSIEVQLAPGYDFRKVQVALLTAAYLYAFNALGYWYILNSNLDAIRQQILGVGVDDLANRAVLQLESVQTRVPELFLVTSPERFQCVVFRFMDAMVVLPKADDRQLSVYDALDEFRRSPLIVSPADPFSDVVSVSGTLRDRAATNLRHGPVTLDSSVEVDTVFAFPDLPTVLRLAPESERPSWAVVANEWRPPWALTG